MIHGPTNVKDDQISTWFYVEVKRIIIYVLV
jgi:hypothetical protein